MALVNTPLPKVNRAVKPACLITGPVLRFTMEQILSSDVCLGKTSCFQCPEGRAGTNGKDCNKCSPGSYNADIGSSCKACPKGQYQEDLAKVRVSFVREENIGIKLEALYHAQTKVDFRTPQAQGCDICEGRKYQSAQGKALCDRCSSTSYSPPGSIICTECPSPLIIDGRLGLAKDASHCVCQSGFFFFILPLLSLLC